MSNIRDLGDLIGNLPESDWLRNASCRDLDLDTINLFFVEAGRSLSREAKAICSSCPVRVECLDHAYANEIAAGYFGGMSPTRRRSLSHSSARALLDDD